jgi:hypothetical protein
LGFHKCRKNGSLLSLKTAEVANAKTRNVG